MLGKSGTLPIFCAFFRNLLTFFIRLNIMTYEQMRICYLVLNDKTNILHRRMVMKKTYNVDVDCANCAAKMEDAVKKTPGVQNAALSFMTLKLKVEFEAGADVDAVMAAARKNCKRVESDCEIFL